MSETDIVLRLLMAVACGGLIGIERERGDRPAGFRTYIMVSLGAALFTILSLIAFAGADPARGGGSDRGGHRFSGRRRYRRIRRHARGGDHHRRHHVGHGSGGHGRGRRLFYNLLYSTGIILAVLIVLPWVESIDNREVPETQAFISPSGAPPGRDWSRRWKRRGPSRYRNHPC